MNILTDTEAYSYLPYVRCRNGMKALLENEGDAISIPGYPVKTQKTILELAAAIYERKAYVKAPSANEYFVMDGSPFRTLSRSAFELTALTYRSDFVTNYAQMEYTADGRAKQVGIDTTGVSGSVVMGSFYYVDSDLRVISEQSETSLFSFGTETYSTSIPSSLGQNWSGICVPAMCFLIPSAGCLQWVSIGSTPDTGLLVRKDIPNDFYRYPVILNTETTMTTGRIRMALWDGGTTDKNGENYTPFSTECHFTGDSHKGFEMNGYVYLLHSTFNPLFVERLRKRIGLLDTPYGEGNHVFLTQIFQSVAEFEATANPGDFGRLGNYRNPQNGRLTAGVSYTFAADTGWVENQEITWFDVINQMTLESTDYSDLPRFGSSKVSGSANVTREETANGFRCRGRAQITCTIGRATLLYKPKFPADDTFFEEGVFNGCELFGMITERVPNITTPTGIAQGIQILNTETVDPEAVLQILRQMIYPGDAAYENQWATNHYVLTVLPNGTGGKIQFVPAVYGAGEAVAASCSAVRLASAPAGNSRPTMRFDFPTTTAAQILALLKNPEAYSAVEYRTSPAGSPYEERQTSVNVDYSLDTQIQRYFERHNPPNWKHVPTNK